MSGLVLRLIQDTMTAGAEFSLRPLNRAVYLVEGEVEVSAGLATVSPLTANSAWSGAGKCTLVAGPRGARVWRWEVDDGRPAHNGVSTVEGVDSNAKSEHELPIAQADKLLIRCDRVDFPLGGIAFTHTHRGPGLRCLLRGELMVRTEETQWMVGPGETWFESGPDPIYAEASTEELTSFVRVLVLPADTLGKPSIRYVKPEDFDKPKTQTYTVFVDRIMSP